MIKLIKEKIDSINSVNLINFLTLTYSLQSAILGAMERRDIVIGFIILAILAGFIFWRQRTYKEEEELTIPQTLSVEDEIEEMFKVEIPEDVDKAELKDVSGGDASAIATRKYEAGKFIHTVLADLPDPETGKFYQGWLFKGDEALVSTGKMREAKGGWIIEFESSTNYTDYNKVVVTLEGTSDLNPEKHILEGSF